ncbi:transposase [Candidatus Omnitrophota bacterium]
MRDIIDLMEEGKVRRYFRARDKLSFEGAISHVTQHASGAEPLFLEGSDYLYMLHLIKKICKKFKISIFCFCLMLNHIHLLIKLGTENLSESMKILFQGYAQYFNKKYDRKGHVFSGTYRSALCFDERYLLAASLYIHLNPVKKKLVTNPASYRWSSCALFLNNVNIDTFIDYKYVLGILDNDISVAHIKYKKLLERVEVERIKGILDQPKALEYIVELIPSEELNNDHDVLFSGKLDEKIQDMKNRGRLIKPEDIRARRFLIKQLKSRGFNMTEIAQKLNLSRKTIHKTLK